MALVDNVDEEWDAECPHCHSKLKIKFTVGYYYDGGVKQFLDGVETEDGSEKWEKEH